MLSNSRRAALWIRTSRLPPVTFPTSSAALCQLCVSDKCEVNAAWSCLQCGSVDYICFQYMYVSMGQLVYKVAKERGLLLVADSDEDSVLVVLCLCLDIQLP